MPPKKILQPTGPAEAGNGFAALTADDPGEDGPVNPSMLDLPQTLLALQQSIQTLSQAVSELKDDQRELKEAFAEERTLTRAHQREHEAHFKWMFAKLSLRPLSPARTSSKS